MANSIAIGLSVDGVATVTGAFENVSRSAGRMASETGAATGRMSTSMRELSGIMGQFGAGLSFGYLIKESISAAMEMEKLNRQFTVFTGSATAAAKEIEFVRAEANRLGLASRELTTSYALFMNAIKGTANEGQKGRDAFIGISEGMAAVGMQAENQSRAWAQLNQGIMKGKFEMEDLKTINEAGLPIFKLLADALDISTEELMKMQKEGRLLANDVLPLLGESMHQAYGVAATESAKSAAAEINRMNNAMIESKAAAGQALLPVFSDIVKGIVPAINMLKEFIGGIQIMAVQIPAAFDKINAWINNRSLGARLMGRTKEDYQAALTTIDANKNATIDDIMKKYTLTGSDYSDAQVATQAKAAADAEASRKLLAAQAATVKNASETAAKIKSIKDKEAQEASDRYQLVLQEQKKAADELVKVEQAASKEVSDTYALVLQDQAKAADEVSQRYQLALQDQEKASKAAIDAIAKEKKAREDLYAWMVAHDPYTGAMQALKDYGAMAAQIGQQTGDMVANMFYEMEDAFVSFIRNGKLSFSSFINSLLDDLARMAVKQGITGPLSSMMAGLMSGTAASFIPSTAGAAVEGLGMASFSPDSLGAFLGKAVSSGAQAGTTAGAMSGISAGLTAMAPMMGVMVAGYLGNSYFGSGGLMSQSTSEQKAMRGAAFGVGVGGSALIGGAAMANAGMMGTSAAALAMAGSVSWIPIAGQIIAGLTALAVGADALTGGGLFGTAWKTKSSGISLGVEDGDFFGQSYYTQQRKKALFGGTKSRTRYGELDPMLAEYLSGQYGDLSSGIGTNAKLTGSSGDLSGFSSAEVKLKLSKKDAEEQQKAIDEYFRTLSNQAIDSLYTTSTTEITTRLGKHNKVITESITTTINALDQYRKLGEDSTDTFNRLTSSAAEVNELFSSLGITLNDVSLAGAAASDALIQAMGGLQKAQSTISGYYGSDLFSDAERQAIELGAAQRLVAKTFTELNLTMPTTALGYRELVNQQLALGATGAEAAAALMEISDAAALVIGTATNLSPAYQSALEIALLSANAIRDIQGSSLNTQTPEQRYFEARRAFEENTNDAMAGELGKTFLAASQQYNASSQWYQKDYDSVMAVLNPLALRDDLTTPIEQQVTILTQIRDALLNNQLVLSSAVNTNIVSELKNVVAELRSQNSVLIAANTKLIELNTTQADQLEIIGSSATLKAAA